MLGYHPEPGARDRAHRAAAAARVRPDARDRRARRGQDRRRALAAHRQRPEGHRRDRGSGRDRGRHRRARLPPVHRIQVERRRDRRRVRDLEGRPLDLGRGRRRADRGRDPRAPAPPRHARAPRRDRVPASSSRRRSAAGATTSTRSCSDGRASCRGRSRSTSRTGRSATSTFATFQPTFLYESIWCLLVFAHDRRGSNGTAVCARVRRSRSTSRCTRFGRIFFEWLRVDPASRIFGIRFNLLLSAVLCVVGSRLVRAARAATEPRRSSPSPAARRAPTAIREPPDSVGDTDSVTCTASDQRSGSDHDDSPHDRGLRRARSTRRRSTARSRPTPRCARSTASTSTFERGVYTAIMGPSGSGKSTLLHCIAGLDTLTSGQVFLGDIELSALSDKELTQIRRDRIGFVFQAYNLIPTLTAIENITLPLALAGPRRPTRSGSTTSSTSSGCAIAAQPPPVGALGRSAAAGRGRPRAREPARDRLRRRAHRQPRLARERRDPRLHEAGGRGVRPDDRDGHPRPDRGVVREPGRVPRRRPGRRRARRPEPRRDPRQDAPARRLAAGEPPCGRSRARDSSAHKLRFLLTALAVDPRRRVHVGHVRAHRDDPEDVRRPVRQHLPGHRRGRARHGGARRPTSAPACGRRSPSRSSTRCRATPGVEARRTATCRSTTRRSSTRKGKAIGKPGTGAPALGFGWDPNPTLNQFRLVAGRPRARDRRRDRDRQAHAPTRATSTSATRSTVLTAKAPRKYTIVGHREVRHGRQPRGRVGRAVHAARRRRRVAGETGQVRRHLGRRPSPGVSQDAGRGEHRTRRSSRTATARSR